MVPVLGVAVGHGEGRGGEGEGKAQRGRGGAALGGGQYFPPDPQHSVSDLEAQHGVIQSLPGKKQQG